MQPGGVRRLVLPDFENLYRAYLKYRDQGDHGKADFIILEIVDQCVRRKPGGELGRFYSTLRGSPTNKTAMIEFVRERTGENVLASVTQTRSLSGLGIATLFRKVKHRAKRSQERVEQIWIRLIFRDLPHTFRSQNVSLASVGELHHWIWDWEQLRGVISATGFIAVERRPQFLH